MENGDPITPQPVPTPVLTEEELEEEVEHLKTLAIIHHGQEVARAHMRFQLEKKHASWIYDVGVKNIDCEYEQALKDSDQSCHEKIMHQRDQIRSDAKELGINFDTKAINVPINRRNKEPVVKLVHSYPYKEFGSYKDTIEYFYVSKNDEMLDSYISKVLALKLQFK